VREERERKWKSGVHFFPPFFSAIFFRHFLPFFSNRHSLTRPGRSRGKGGRESSRAAGCGKVMGKGDHQAEEQERMGNGRHRRLLLLVLLVQSVCSAPAPGAACPPHATLLGQHCVCEPGFDCLGLRCIEGKHKDGSTAFGFRASECPECACTPRLSQVASAGGNGRPVAAGKRLPPFVYLKLHKVWPSPLPHSARLALPMGGCLCAAGGIHHSLHSAGTVGGAVQCPSLRARGRVLALAPVHGTWIPHPHRAAACCDAPHA
jgi:hypothetical protein